MHPRFVANIGGIMGLCMGCSLVTIFEVCHHVLLIFLKTGKKSVSRIQKTMKSTNERTGDILMKAPGFGRRLSQRRRTEGQGRRGRRGGRKRARIQRWIALKPRKFVSS